MRDLQNIMAIYAGSDGDATKALYQDLERIGPVGIIALNLFRAHKCSARAKVYRGGGYRGMAYDRKAWSLGNLATALAKHAAPLAITWGWGLDAEQAMHRHVLYVDLPTGQVSFHNGERYVGPDYPGAWDGVVKMGDQRICRWIADIFAAAKVPA